MSEQLRDGSTLSLKRHTSVFLPRNAGGRSPGRACMPLLLESWKYKILLAGKYLNVIECGIEVQVDQKDLTKISPSMEDEKCISS
jgi:gamma-tubulin complex component 2